MKAIPVTPAPCPRCQETLNQALDAYDLVRRHGERCDRLKELFNIVCQRAEDLEEVVQEQQRFIGLLWLLLATKRS